MTNLKKIIIIEDDEFFRELMISKLKNENYKIITATNKEDGLKKIKKEKPNLILVNIIIPRISGFEFLKEIKKDSTLFSIPIIIISNLGQVENIKKYIELGATDYIMKAHFTPNEIINIIKKYI